MKDIHVLVKHDLKLAYASSLIIAILMAAGSITSILYWNTIYPASKASSSVGSDAFNLVAILPILLISMGLAYRGSLIGLLLWPGTLFYVLYIYAFLVIGVPFNALFLLYIALAVLSAYTIIGLITSVNGDAVCQRLVRVVPKRAASGVLVVLAVLFIAMDAYAVVSALTSHISVDVQTQSPWIIDLTVECPALLIGGILLWRGIKLGYVAGAGLLLQMGMLLIGLPISLMLGAWLTGSPIDWSTSMLIVIGVIPIAFLAFFMRDTVSDQGPSST